MSQTLTKVTGEPPLNENILFTFESTDSVYLTLNTSEANVTTIEDKFTFTFDKLRNPSSTDRKSVV